MDFCIIIPAHNEEAFLSQTLQSLVEQSLLPKTIIVVNDASTDGTQSIIDHFSTAYPFIHGVTKNPTEKNAQTEEAHAPGSKVIRAFYRGYNTLVKPCDVICKFDADLVFPQNYLSRIAQLFGADPKIGMAGGFCHIEKNGKWVLENLTNKDHIRGALKAYRKECFEQIGGLRSTMGWDTVDELLAQYHGWKIVTDPSLAVKHLKPTGKVYTPAARYKQGEAFYRLRYGFWLTFIASGKMALKKRNFSFFLDSLKGYRKAKKKNEDFIVSAEEGNFIRNLRWCGIKRKIGMD